MAFQATHSRLRRLLLAAAVFAGASIAQPASAQVVPTLNAAQFGPQMIGAPVAWARGYNGAGIVMVVADSGIDPNHPAFTGKIDLARSRSFVLSSAGAAYNPNDISDLTTQSHGTHVAGIMAAAANSNAPGIGFGANLIVFKMIQPCEKGCSAPGVNSNTGPLELYAGYDNVWIYNGSYGPDAAANSTIWPADGINPDEAEAARLALAKGKLLVMANGNDGLKSPVASANPSGLALYPFMNPTNAKAGGVYADGNNNYNFSYLLDQPGLIIAVAAVGQAKTVAGYSQKCGVTASWCVAAPGGDIPTDAGIYSTFPNNNYGAIDGTSMATPMVSGALAVLAQAYPGYAPRDWATVLFATAENIGTGAGVNAISGYGLIRLDRATDGPTTLAAGSAVDVAAQNNTYWSQPLTTAGGFTKTGAGYLIVAGRTTAAGEVAVNAGALGVGGTLTLQSGMTVAQGASIAGFGRIVGNTIINGTLDPGQLPNYADLKANNGGNIPAGIPLTGTSIGTLTFQGNVTLAATATMIEGIDGALIIPGGPGTFDKTIVTGTGAVFTAGGTLAPTLRNIVGGNNTYSPPVGTSFLIVSAQNGATVTGNFATLTQPTAGLAANTRLDVVYAATGITLNVTPLNFQALQQRDNANPNQQAVAAALDTVRPQAGAAPRSNSKAVFDDLYDNSAAEDDAEFEALSGEGQAANPGTTLTTFAGFADQIADRQAATLPNTSLASLDDPAAPQLAMLETANDWQAWAQGFGRWSHIDADLGLPGSKTDANGFTLGVDAAFGTDLRAGVAFGFAQTTTTAAGEAARTNAYVGAAYAAWTPDAWVIEGRIAIGPASTDSRRLVTLLGVPTVVTGSYTGWGFLFSADAGYRMDWGAITAKPYVGLTVQTLEQGDFVETSSIGLSFPSQTFTKVTSEVGLRMGTDFDFAGLTFAPDLKLAWAHDLSDDSLTSHAALFGAPFEILAADPGADALLVDASISTELTDKLSAFAGYAGEFRANAASQEVRGGLRLSL